MTFEEFQKEWLDNESYIIAHTSGSTGKPKAIKLDKEFVLQSALRTNNFFNINSESHLYSCVSADFIGGKMMAVRALACKAKLSWEVPSNQPLKNLSKQDVIDLLSVVPSQMHSILDRQGSLPKIRNIIIGGSAIPPSLKDRIAESGLNAFETYGMTETASHIALKKITNENSPFKLLPGISISSDTDSCLNINFNTGTEIQTNDIVRIINENEFFILGRRDNMIISGGRKINPFELEEKIAPLIPLEFYLKGTPDEKWGQKLLLVIEGSPSSINEKSLLEKMEKVLERWQLPKDIIYCQSFERTSNGKLLRL